MGDVPYDFKPVGSCNLPEVADGLADLSYVAYCGTAAALGIDMEPIFQEVHRSNMNKLWTQSEVNTDPRTKNGQLTAKINQEVLMSQDSFDNPTDRVYLVKNQDGKVIKPNSFTSPDVESILYQQNI